MKKVLMLVVVLFAFLVTPVLAAPATKIPYTDYMKDYKPPDPGKEWITDDGIYHTKGEVQYIEIWGYHKGRVVAIVDMKINLNTGNGEFHSKWVFTNEAGTGTFEGSICARLRGGLVVSGRLIGFGAGEYEGQQVKARYYSVDESTTKLEGIILIPKG